MVVLLKEPQTMAKLVVTLDNVTAKVTLRDWLVINVKMDSMDFLDVELVDVMPKEVSITFAIRPLVTVLAMHISKVTFVMSVLTTSMTFLLVSNVLAT